MNMENSKPVMVVGATGFLGTEICRQLVAANKNVKGLIRSTSDPVKVKTLRDMGVQTVIGDIKERITLDLAFADVGAVISTVSSTVSRSEGDSIETVDKEGQLNVVDAAKDAGATQFIFISFLESPEKFPLQDAKREVERRIIESSMNYTILRPTFFMEIWLSPHLGFDAANNTATIYGTGEEKISWIAVKDVATFAVASLDNETAKNSIIDLGGPEALSPLEVVHLFEEQKENSFELHHVPEETLRAQANTAQDSLQRSFAALMLTYAGGAKVRMDTTLNLFPINLTTVKEYSRQLVQHEVAEV